MRPVVCYGSETWVLTSSDASKLRVFERRVIRRIIGPTYENGIWKVRRNCEIDDFLHSEDIVRFIKSGRIRWIGHLSRMNVDRISKRLWQGKIFNRRRKGRPRNRWTDDVERDLRILGVRNWKRQAEDRIVWRGFVKEAKGHIGL